VLCPEAVLLGQAGPLGVAASLSCKRWSCGRCRLLNSAKLAQLIRDLGPTLFITLTDTPHHGESADARARKLMADFRLLRRRARRWMGSKMDFVAVFEATQRGEPHLHLAVVRCPVRPTVLEKKLHAWLGGSKGSRRVRVKTVYDRDGLARYMSKDPHKFAGCKRFWSSLGWRIVRPVADAKFRAARLIRASLGVVERQLRADGLAIVSRSPRRILFTPP
jgi:hypothetical protein